MNKNIQYAVCKLPEEEDDTINVCSKWLLDNGTKTLYPPKSQWRSLRKYLIHQVSPKSTWKKYPVIVMGYYETYEKAKDKLIKSCETSNLESSDEEKARRSRNVRRKKDLTKEFLEPDSSDENQIPEKNLAATKNTSGEQILPYPVFSCSEQVNTILARSPAPHTATTVNSFETEQVSSQTCNTLAHSLSPRTPQSAHFESLSAATSPTLFSTQRYTQPIPTQSPFTVGDRTILSQIQLTLAELVKKQNDILNKLNNLHHEERPDQTVASLPDLFGNLPLTSPDQFMEFKEKLDDQLSKQLVRLLTSVGGKDLQQAIFNMLRRIMTDELGITFSFSGKTMAGISKTAFSKTILSKCILVAVQKMFGPREATEAKYATIAAKWFQQAKTRVERRGKKTGANQERREENDLQRNEDIDNDV